MINYNVVCIIMAGGLGTRVRPLSLYFNKCMLPLGYRFKPLIEYIIRCLVYYNINDIYVVCHYKHDQIAGYIKYLIKELERNNINIICTIDNLEGTGKALLKVYEEYLRDRNIDLVLVHYSDILTNLDYSKYLDYVFQKSCDASIVVCKGLPIDVGLVCVDREGMVRCVKEKPHLEIDYGIGIFTFSKKCLELVYKTFSNRKDNLDIARDILPYLIEDNKKVCAYFPNLFQRHFVWYDVGNLRTYENINHNEIDKNFEYLFE